MAPPHKRRRQQQKRKEKKISVFELGLRNVFQVLLY